MITVDRKTIIQILGGIMARPELLSDIDKYQLEPTDFSQQLDKFVFSAIYNLYVGGAEKIHATDIDAYLGENEVAKNIMERENGTQFLLDCETHSEPSNFAYYYRKLKKLNLMRELQRKGYDVSGIYSEDPLEENHFSINEKFEKLNTGDILNKIKGEIADLENRYVINTFVKEGSAFDGVKDLIASLQVQPEVGVRLQGDIFNTITRGGRKGKLYLRSAGSGVGKTRTMVGDACNIAYPIRYEPKYHKWIATGKPEKVLYIMTEQEPAEIQTMILAYLTGYNEEMFLYGTFGPEHMDRISKALSIMEMYKDNFLTAQIPDPSASVIKNLFRKYNLQKGVENFFYDYIFSSPAMLNEYRDLGLREDVCLRLFTTALKNVTVELDVFTLTATQISNDEGDGFKDFRNIRGSKAIVDLCDFACIMSRPSIEELKVVAGFQKLFSFSPDCVTDIFKNRRGRWTMVRVWSKMDLGTCRRYDLFVTTPDLKAIGEFQIVDFVQTKDQKLIDLELLYNEGEVTDDMEQQLIENFSPEIAPQSLLDEVTKAFGDERERKERLKSVSIEELL